MHAFDALDQRNFRADDHEADPILGAEGFHRLLVAHVEGDELRMIRYPRIARRGEQRVAFASQQPGLRQLPCQRMFAPARAQQQDIHGRLPLRRQN